MAGTGKAQAGSLRGSLHSKPHAEGLSSTPGSPRLEAAGELRHFQDRHVAIAADDVIRASGVRTFEHLVVGRSAVMTSSLCVS